MDQVVSGNKTLKVLERRKRQLDMQRQTDRQADRLDSCAH